MLILLVNAYMLMMLRVVVKHVHSVSYVHAFIVVGYLCSVEVIMMCCWYHGVTA